MFKTDPCDWPGLIPNLWTQSTGRILHFASGTIHEKSVPNKISSVPPLIIIFERQFKLGFIISAVCISAIKSRRYRSNIYHRVLYCRRSARPPRPESLARTRESKPTNPSSREYPISQRIDRGEKRHQNLILDVGGSNQILISHRIAIWFDVQHGYLRSLS